MRKKSGLVGSIISIVMALVGVGVFLAILAQFGGNLGEFLRWILDLAWGIVISVRDAILGWNIFGGIF